MKVLQINSAKAFGGGEKHLVDLCQGLQNCGHRVFTAVRPGNQWQEKLAFLPPENLVHFPLLNSTDVFSAKKIAGYIREKQIEVIHAHVARDYPLAALASRLSRTPLVITRHLTYPLSAIHRLTFRQAEKVIAVSKGVAESLLKRRLIEPKKVAVIYNGVDTERLEKIKRNNQSGEELIVAVVGELREHKGQEDFIKAAAIAVQRHPSAKFLIIGQDNSGSQQYRIYLENLVRGLKLENRVVFTGWLDSPEEIYGAFDIFVSSARSEPFGLVIAESMASEKGIVATKTVGAEELLTDNETGKLVSIGNIEELAEAVCELLTDADLRRELGANARRRVRDFFSLEKMIAETEKVYRTVI